MYGSDWGPLSSALNGLDLNGHGGGRWQFNDGDDAYSESEVSSIGTMGELGEDARLGEDRERVCEEDDEDEDDEEDGGGDGDDEDFSRGETEGKDDEEDGKVDENTNNWEVSLLSFSLNSRSRAEVASTRFPFADFLFSPSCTSLSLPNLLSFFLLLFDFFPSTAHVTNNPSSHASFANRSPSSFLLRRVASSSCHARKRSRRSSVGRDGSRG